MIPLLSRSKPTTHLNQHGDTTISTSPTLDAVRAAIAASKAKRNRGSSTKPPSANWPYFNTPSGGTSECRFLPDADPENLLFWTRRYQVKMSFAGVIGGQYPSDQDVLVTFTSNRTFDLPCPVIDLTKPLWDDPATEHVARRYYPKQSGIAQCLVVHSGFQDAPPDNPIRTLVLLPSIIGILEDALNDLDREHSPVDYEHGANFLFQVTTQGSFRNYSKSKFRKESPLTDEQRAAIDTYGLRSLKAELGDPLPQAALDLLPDMLAASIAGEPFDQDRWGEHFKAWPADGSSFRSHNAAAKPAANQTTDSILSAIARRNTVTVSEPVGK